MVEVASQSIGEKVDFAINGEKAVDYPRGKEFGLHSMANPQISLSWIKGTYKKNKFALLSSFQGHTSFFILPFLKL